MTSHRYRQSRGGFTLIELLVAIALLGISMTLVLGVYRSVFSVVEQVDGTSSFQGRTALLIDQLQRDFYGMYKGKSGFFRAGIEADQSDDILLFEFTTTSQLRFGSAAPSEAVAVVRYSLKKTGNGRRYQLYRYEIPLLFGESDESRSDAPVILVSEQVVDFRLSFMDRYGSFIDRWEARSSIMNDGPDDDRYPRLVRIEIELAGGPEKGAKKKTVSHALAIPVSRYAAAAANEES